MARGMMSPAICTPRSFRYRTLMSATGSPACSRVVLQGDVRAHGKQHVDDAGAGGVHAHIPDQEVRSGDDARGDHEERRGGDVRRDLKGALRPQRPASP